MNQPLLIIVTGAPCTGKTVLAREISRHSGMPLFSRDDFKETLFNSLGSSNRSWSRKLGRASYDLLFYVLNQFSLTKKSLIVESNFDAILAKDDFLKIESLDEYNILQIVLSCDFELLISRFSKRAASGERHPGHVDLQNIDELTKSLKERDFGAINLKSTILKINTDNFESINTNKIYEEITRMTHGSSVKGQNEKT